MSEYIITIPDSYFPRSDTYRDIYYPDERHNPMPLEEIVRCRDCEHYTHSSWHRCDLYSIAHEVEPDGFCAWGERR